jgi:2-amino-4-hydroxy-6-hydroxymethyldihydropteridine diphosphokinase
MTTAYLSLGCNRGDCGANLATAVRKLKANAGIDVTGVSSIYVTEPVGNPDQPDFLNITVGLDTSLTPRDLHAICGAIEVELGGRHDRVPLGPRTIDIDILLYGDMQTSDPELTLPHPRMLTRAFVLAPLAEIAPEAPIPGGGTVAAALENLHDSHNVEKKGPLTV